MKLKIRWKFFILLFLFSLIPLFIVTHSNQKHVERMGAIIADNTGRTLSKLTRETLFITATGSAETLLRSKKAMEMGLTAFAQTVEQSLLQESEEAGEIYYDEMFDAPDQYPQLNLIEQTDYIRQHKDGSKPKQLISLDHPVLFTPKGIPRAGVKKKIAALHQLTPLLKSYRAEFGNHLHWLYVSLEEGVHVSYPGHGGYPENYDPRKRPWYQNVHDEKVHWTLPIIDATTGLVTFTASKWIHRPDGSIAGVAAFDILVSDVIAKRALSAVWSKDMKLFLTGCVRKHQAHEPGLVILAQEEYQQKEGNKNGLIDFEWLSSSNASGFRQLVKQCQKKLSGIMELPYKGRDSIWAHAYVDADMHLFIIVPKSVIKSLPEKQRQTVMEFTERFQMHAVFVTIGVLLLLSGAAFYISKAISKTLVTISSAAQRLSQGDLSARIDLKTGDERDTVIKAFNQMGPHLENHFKILKALELAQEVQQNLLPMGTTHIPGLDIAGSSMYCDETGGDYYDFINVGPQAAKKLAVIIGDVSGHGIASALLMATARALLRQRIAMLGEAHTIISDVNRQLVQDTHVTNQFMTLFYCEFDMQESHLTWVRAGHEPAIVYDQNQDAFFELKECGMALGVDDAYEYKKFKQTLIPGQTIFLGTDGIWETRNAQGQMFGKESLRNILRDHANEPAIAIRDAIAAALSEFRGSTSLLDDVTMVVIKVKRD